VAAVLYAWVWACLFLYRLLSKKAQFTCDNFICMFAKTCRKPTTASHNLLWARLCWFPMHGPWNKTSAIVKCNWWLTSVSDSFKWQQCWRCWLPGSTVKVNRKWTAFMQRFSYQWPLTAQHSPTHSHCNSGVNPARRPPAHWEQLGWVFVLRDTIEVATFWLSANPLYLLSPMPHAEYKYARIHNKLLPGCIQSES
jgi:hypothetical protein